MKMPILLVLSGLIAALGCSSGGGAATEIFADPPLQANFTPEQPNPSVMTVAAARNAASGDNVEVSIEVTGVSNVFGADFAVTYDPAHAVFLGWTAGNFLESDGQSVIYLVNTESGRIEVGASRQGGGGVSVGTPPRSLINLTFRVLDEGDSAFGFDSPDLLDAQPPAPQSITGLSWFGGTIVGI